MISYLPRIPRPSGLTCELATGPSGVSLGIPGASYIRISGLRIRSEPLSTVSRDGGPMLCFIVVRASITLMIASNHDILSFNSVMTTTGDAMSLVQPGQSSSNFAQQGTVDWAAESQTTFSASVAILSRFSRAGLQPLTVAIAQALSVNIPFGIHGEKRLNRAMSGLKAFGGLEDLIFVGFGVQHVLRVLVQTSQGASSVTLVASRTEGHSTMYASDC